MDVRADGGYVVAPPSSTPAGEYQVLNDADPLPAPAWLIERAMPAKPSQLWRPTSRKPPAAPAKPERRYVEAALDAETHAVATAAPGRRNDTLNRAAYTLPGSPPTAS